MKIEKCNNERCRYWGDGWCNKEDGAEISISNSGLRQDEYFHMFHYDHNTGTIRCAECD